ncbi:quinone-oxidoreductase [Pyrus ussuriensis x Pyrus communis]|uniref:Quinone-oxidoreductase n=1 Tax=Pyrus ussuriensis x Pyrus communis TaxID=2448454 RepID=A0A5N5GGQ1_9ROSA|nr:quinone-oxidoreductase [Pyrus ussuriensis x Pyrus communis]
MSVSLGGGLAEYAAASENMTVTRPPEVSPAEAAGLPIAGFKLTSLSRNAGVKLDGSGQQKNIFITAASDAGRSSAFVTFALKKLTFSKKLLVPLPMNFKAENLEYLVSLVKEGKLKTVIDSTHLLSKAEDAWARSIDKHATGKIIVEP